MSDFLLEVKNAKESAIKDGKTCFSQNEIEIFYKRYDEIINLDYLENPQPRELSSSPPKKGRKKKGYILALIKRLSDYKDEILLFASDFSIPFTNNLAEQSIRHVKVKTKNAGCFRSMQGATAYLKIQSFLDTVRKQGENTFSALAAVFTGDFRFGIGF